MCFLDLDFSVGESRTTSLEAALVVHHDKVFSDQSTLAITKCDLFFDNPVS